jgi:hypothetical protein
MEQLVAEPMLGDGVRRWECRIAELLDMVGLDPAVYGAVPPSCPAVSAKRMATAPCHRAERGARHLRRGRLVA